MASKSKENMLHCDQEEGQKPVLQVSNTLQVGDNAQLLQL